MDEVVSKQAVGQDFDIDFEGQDPYDRLQDAIVELDERIATTPPGPHRRNLEVAKREAEAQLAKPKTTGVVQSLMRSSH